MWKCQDVTDYDWPWEDNGEIEKLDGSSFGGCWINVTGRTPEQGIQLEGLNSKGSIQDSTLRNRLLGKTCLVERAYTSLNIAKHSGMSAEIAILGNNGPSHTVMDQCWSIVLGKLNSFPYLETDSELLSANGSRRLTANWDERVAFCVWSGRIIEMSADVSTVGTFGRTLRKKAMGLLDRSGTKKKV
jgi:hypothetical protein